jgi:DNA-binding CsgD family transcriptional regulator
LIPPVAPSGRLVGRDAELAALELTLDELREARSGAVYITGEPGIGKTALIAELLRRSAERGHRTLSGRAAEFESGLPFAVFNDALERGLGSRGAEDLDLPEDALAVLGSMFPLLASGPLGNDAAAQPGDRHLSLAALRVLLGRLAEKSSLVLGLDDLHWADAASVDLVCQLLHRGIESPVLLVLASRPAQTAPRLLTVVEEAERHGLCRRLEPAPLSAAEAGELLGDDVEPTVREVLYRESGGNPFYLEQLVGASRRGTDVPSASRGGPDMGIPAAVSAAIEQEIAVLPERARSMLQAGAALGESFEADLAAETADLAESDALEALDELVSQDLIRPAESAQRFRFRHPIVRRAVYESAALGWRLAAHRRAASALEARGAPAVARAHHVEQYAGVGDETAIAILTQAGQETSPRAPASAAQWFAAALRLMPEGGETRERRLGLLVQRAAALGFAGNVEENREALRAFVRIAPRDSNPLRMKAAMLAAMLDDLLGHQDEARKLLDEELAAMPDQDSAEGAELKRVLSFTHYLDADWPAVSRWARASLSADCQGMVKVGALSALALAQQGLEDMGSAARSVSDAAKLFDRLTADEVAQQPGITGWLGWAEVCTEHFDDAVRHLERATTIAGASRQRPLTVGLYGVKGQALALMGDIRGLAEVVDSAFEAALLATSNLFLSWAMTQKCALETQRGDLYAAVRFGEQGVSTHSASGSPLTHPAHLQLAEALLEIGQPERCLEQLLDANGDPNLPAFPPHQARCYELLTMTELALEHPERAAEFAERAREVAERLGLRIPITQALRAQAGVALEGGRAEEALDRARGSIQAAEKAGARVEGARSRILAGRALEASGERDRAVEELQVAHAQLSDCGALHYCHEAARELRQLGHVVRHARDARAGESPVGALTPRELEVIELVANGKTNRQIADELFLSVRTIDSHVSRIFEKLDVNSRAAAASEFERARAGTDPGVAIGG